MKFIHLLLLLLSTTACAQVQTDSSVIKPSDEYPFLPKKKITYSSGTAVKIEFMDPADSVKKTVYYDEDGKDKYDYSVLDNYTLKKCTEVYSDYIADFELKKGEVIADVGTGSGFFPGAVSVICDSITFYLEDIDTSVLNQREFNKTINFFSSIRSLPQTNTFHFTIGTKKATLLPDSIFDKVILMNTFHEIAYPHEMIDDILKKLKPGGILIIDDSFSKKNKTRKAAGCYKKAYKVSKVIEIMAEHGLFLTKMTDPENSFMNVLFFEKNKARSDAYYEKISSVEPYLLLAESLDKLSVSDDSLTTRGISEYLLARLDSIKHLYKDFEYFISEIANEHMEESQYRSAINVCRLNLKLFPNSADAHFDLGDAYYIKGKAYQEMDLFERALYHYKKSVELDSAIAHGQDNISEVEKILLTDEYSDPYNHYTSNYDTSYDYTPEYHWPFINSEVPPYIAVALGYEGLQTNNLMGGLAVNLANLSGDVWGGMAGAIFSYKQNIQDKAVYSYEGELGIYGPIVFGLNYNYNHTPDASLGSFKPFIGISFYNFQLFYGYSFYNGKKDIDQVVRHNRFTLRYIIPIKKIFNNN